MWFLIINEIPGGNFVGPACACVGEKIQLRFPFLHIFHRRGAESSPEEGAKYLIKRPFRHRRHSHPPEFLLNRIKKGFCEVVNMKNASDASTVNRSEKAKLHLNAHLDLQTFFLFPFSAYLITVLHADGSFFVSPPFLPSTVLGC